MINKVSTTFCVLPWIHSFVNIEGDYQICCTSEETDNKLYHDEKPLMFSESVSPADAQNSQTLCDVRKKMMKGEWPDACKRCRLTEEYGGKSRRQIDNFGYQLKYGNDSLIKLINHTNQSTGAINNVPIRWVDFRLGNICNLKCRMCSPRASRQWVNEWNQITKPLNSLTDFPEDWLGRLRNINWAEENLLVDQTISIIDQVEYMHFAGGEPMAINKMHALLEAIVQSGYAKNIILSFNTNCTLLPKEVLKYFTHFKSVRLFLSVDGYGDLNGYIRYPTKWNEVEKNLNFIDENYKDLNLSSATISTTVQAYNVCYLEELINFTRKFKNIAPIPNFHNLFWPEYLDSRVLPLELKQTAIEKIEKIEKEMGQLILGDYQYLLDSLISVKGHLQAEDLHSKNFEKFKAFTNDIDKRNSQNIRDVFPEIRYY